MVNYQNGKIYKIVSNKIDSIYVGSTCKQYLSNRMGGHLSAYKRYKEGKSKNTCSSFKIIESGNYDIVLIEKFPCKSKDELRARERYWQENINNSIYSRRPIITKEEEEIRHRERSKNRREKDKLTNRNCPCGGKLQDLLYKQHVQCNKHQKWIKKEGEWLEEQRSKFLKSKLL